LGFINSDNPVNIGFWGFYDSFDDIVLISNCLTEKGIREKALKSSLKKLISKKLFTSSESEDNTQERYLFTTLNEKYKELNSQQPQQNPSKDLELISNRDYKEEKNIKKQETEAQKKEDSNIISNKNKFEMDLELNHSEEATIENINAQEPKIPTTAINAEENQAEKTESNTNNISNNNRIENIHIFEKQNKMLNEIMNDIQNIDNIKNNLDNILENEAHMDLINIDNMHEDFDDPRRHQSVPSDRKIEENQNQSNVKLAVKLEADFATKAQGCGEEENSKSVNYKPDQEFDSKMENYKNENTEEKMQIDYENTEQQRQEKLLESDKDFEALCGLKDKLLAMEEKFSEYLKQYEKEWDSPVKRVEWVIII